MFNSGIKFVGFLEQLIDTYSCVSHGPLHWLLGLGARSWLGWEQASSAVRTCQRSSAIQPSHLWLVDLKPTSWISLAERLSALSPVMTYIWPLCWWLCKVSTVPMHWWRVEVRPGAGPTLRLRGEWPERVKCSAQTRGGLWAQCGSQDTG